jgi:hypothetical protein
MPRGSASGIFYAEKGVGAGNMAANMDCEALQDSCHCELAAIYQRFAAGGRPPTLRSPR